MDSIQNEKKIWIFAPLLWFCGSRNRSVAETLTAPDPSQKTWKVQLLGLSHHSHGRWCSFTNYSGKVTRFQTNAWKMPSGHVQVCTLPAPVEICRSLDVPDFDRADESLRYSCPWLPYSSLFAAIFWRPELDMWNLTYFEGHWTQECKGYPKILWSYQKCNVMQW